MKFFRAAVRHAPDEAAEEVAVIIGKEHAEALFARFFGKEHYVFPIGRGDVNALPHVKEGLPPDAEHGAAANILN